MKTRILIFFLRAFSLFCFLVAVEQTASAIVPLIAGAAIGAGASLVSGLLGFFGVKSAADKAADAQKAAADRAVATADRTNPWITDAAKGAGNDLRYQAGLGAEGVTGAAGTAAAGMDTAVTQANRLLNPYADLGASTATTLQAGLAPGGEFNKTPTLAELQMDPGYAFRTQQGQQAIERSAAARGGVMGGGVMKDLTTYSQGAASQEYQNAFDRFQTSTQNRYANLFQATRAGQEAAGRQGTALTASAEYGGNITERGAEYAGNLTTDAAKTAGGWDVNAANEAARNSMAAVTQANQYTTGAAGSEAAGTIGGINAINAGISGGLKATYPVFNKLQNPANDYISPSTLGAWQGPAEPPVDTSGKFYGPYATKP